MILYVDIHAPHEGNGSKETPFTRINDAARVAMPGDEVLVAPGVYREYVNPQHAGTEEKPIIYRSVEPLKAVITGAEMAKGWKVYQGNTWALRVSNSAFGSYNPYTTQVYGDWYFSKEIRHTGAVYLNDRMMYEAVSLQDCVSGTKWPYSWEPEYTGLVWYTEQDGDKTVLYANFHGADPNKENVEINVRRECFMPDKTGVSYITVDGFTITKAATTWAPPAAYQDGMIGPHWSKGWVIENCDISNSKCAGISLGKYYDPENDHYFTRKHVKSPTQMERDAVCRGQYHGWLKEKVGGHLIRHNHIHHCEQDGIVGRMGAVFSVIEDNEIDHINNMQQLGGAEISAIKLHAAIDVVIRRNHIHHSTMGIWCDWQAQGTRISQNFLHDNMAPDGVQLPFGAMCSQDIFIEVGHGPTLIDNNILLSKVSARLATEGVAFVHNLLSGPLTCIGRGTDNIVNGINEPRYTPYHIRHRTEVAGFMSILHGDDRFYNNVFVQCWPSADYDIKQGNNAEADNHVCGTSIFDGYPTYDEWIRHFELDNPRPDMHAMASWHFAHLPVWSEGNAYFSGARAWEHEKNGYTSEEKVTLSVEERDGKYYLKTNLFELLAGDASSGCGPLGDKVLSSRIIDSDVLGYAFEPEQRFEDPDGSTIVFNRDYFGGHRGLTTIPGPFADPEELERPVWG